ncbi:MAG: NADAR family protein [Bacteroidota bacterium]
MDSVIRFYSTNQAWGEFSNFAAYPIKLKGKVWPTSEHFFQAQKFAGTSMEDKVRKAPSPMKAAEMGRNRRVKIVKNWDHKRDNVMLEAVRAKFTQHEDLAALLISTGDAKLIEHTENDSYWGDGRDGSGKNRLGKILMKVRDELNRKS